MEFTTSYSGMDIGESYPINTYSDDNKSGIRFGINSNLYTSWAVKYKDGDATGTGKSTNTSTGITESLPRLTQFNSGKINHLVYRYNVSLKRIEIFINGTPFTHHIDFSKSNEPNLLVSAIGFNRIDANTNPAYKPPNNTRNTKVYDVKAYSKMLSDEEILQNYNNLVKNGVISNG